MIHSKRLLAAFLLTATLYLFPSRASATITVVSDWRLGESEPTAIAGTPAVTTIDYIGSRNLTFQGAATYSSDVGFPAALRVGSILSVNFTNNAYATNSIVSTAVDNFGIEGWVKPLSANDGVLFYNGNTATSGWGIMIRSGVYTGLYGGVAYIIGSPVDVGVWTHVALVRNNGSTTLYINASPVANVLSTPNTPVGSFALACAPEAPGEIPFTGLIDEVRVFTFTPGQFTASDLLANFPVAPITPLPPTQITSTSAMLNGAVFPRGVDTSAWLEWGLTTGYGNSNSPVPVGNGTNSVPLSNPITGLQPGHTYHYRAVAQTASGIARSWDQTFVTPVINVSPSNQTTYVRVPFTNPVATLTASPLALSANDGANGMVLKADGRVSVWGDNSVNQTNIAGTLSNIVGIAAANYHFIALRRDGTVIAWGLNTIGQTVVPPGLDNVVAVAGGGDYSMALRRDGVVTSWGPALPFSQPLTNIIQISASLGKAVALTADGKVLYNGGVPPEATNVVAVAAGGFHVMALRADGNVVVWGLNNVGQTNIPPQVTNVAAISATGDGCLALLKNGTVIAWGGEDGGKNFIPPEVTNVVAIAAAGSANFAIRADGAVFGWGASSGNQTTVPDDLTNITGVVNVSGSVNTNAPGTNTLIYTTTNFLNAINSATVSVSVALPRLTFTPSVSKTALLSWPSNATGYLLQQTALIGSNGWTAASTGPTNPATIPTTNSFLFYRLIHP